MTISTQLNGLETIKSNIRQAIIDKGVAVSVSDAFSVYPDKISQISGGGGGGGTNSTGAKRGNVTGDSTGYTGWTSDDYIQLPYTFDINEDWTFKIQVDITEFPNEISDLATTAYIWSLCTWDNGNDCIWETDGEGHMVPGFAVNYSGYIAGVKFGIQSWIDNYPHPWFEVTHDATNHQTSVKWWIQEGTNINWGPFDDTTWNICNHLCRVGIGAGAQLPSGIKIMTVEYNGEAWTPEEWNGVVMRSKEITENGTYNAITDHIDGYTGVSVNVAEKGIPREVSAEGVYQIPTSNFTFSLPSNVKEIGYRALYYAFYQSGITSVGLSNLETVGAYHAMRYAFYGCTGITSVDLSNLKTITATSSMGYVFANCTNLSSVDFSSLNAVKGSQCLQNAFQNTSITTLSFPALKSDSFGSHTDQFNNMLSGVTGCTVHFPSNLQSVIGSWSDVTAGFGGTNTTVLFDLPATT